MVECGPLVVISIVGLCLRLASVHPQSHANAKCEHGVWGSSQTAFPRSGESKNSGPAVAVIRGGRQNVAMRDRRSSLSDGVEGVQTLGKKTASHSAPTPKQYTTGHRDSTATYRAQVPHTLQSLTKNTRQRSAAQRKCVTWVTVMCVAVLSRTSLRTPQGDFDPNSCARFSCCRRYGGQPARASLRGALTHERVRGRDVPLREEHSGQRHL